MVKALKNQLNKNRRKMFFLKKMFNRFSAFSDYFVGLK